MTETAFRLLADPLTCPGGYVLHLYCRYENPDHGFREFPHSPDSVKTYGEAKRWAGKRGWILHRDGTATCPKCAKRLAAGEKPYAVGDAP